MDGGCSYTHHDRGRPTPDSILSQSTPREQCNSPNPTQPNSIQSTPSHPSTTSQSSRMCILCKGNAPGRCPGVRSPRCMPPLHPSFPDPILTQSRCMYTTAPPPNQFLRICKYAPAPCSGGRSPPCRPPQCPPLPPPAAWRSLVFVGVCVCMCMCACVRVCVGVIRLRNTFKQIRNQPSTVVSLLHQSQVK